MFQRLYELSGLLGINQLNPWELINHGMEPQYDRGFAICFDEHGYYAGIKVINSSRGIEDRGVVYLPGPSSAGPPLNPCARLSAKMEKKIHYLFQVTGEVGSADGVSDEWRDWFEKIDWRDKSLQKKIVVEIAQQASESGVGRKREDGRIHSGYCFCARYDRGHIQPVYECEAAKRLMVEKAAQVWKKHGVRQGTCSICGETAEVFGNFAELKCYSLDKPGLIAGGFINAQASRNFPVCENCAFSLSFAVRYCMKNLKSGMAGQKYIVLPYCSAGRKIQNYIKKELTARPNRFSISAHCDLLVNFDDELLSFMQEEELKEQLAFSLIFFSEHQKEWKILAEVQQVLPGRIRQISDARQQARKDILLSAAGKDGQPVSISALSFNIFSRAGGSKESKKIFCQWMASIFGDGRIDRRVLLLNIIKTILAVAGREPQQLHFIAAQAWGVYLFCDFLNLIPKRGKSMPANFSDSPFGRYMSTHADFFEKKETAAAFLTGAYVQTVCYVQKKKREMKKSDQAPFAKKFMGRLLSKKHLMRLFTEAHDKLEIYGGTGLVIANGLEPELSRAWVECGNRWNINDEEATFAFTIGYCLTGRIGNKSYETDGKEENR